MGHTVQAHISKEQKASLSENFQRMAGVRQTEKHLISRLGGTIKQIRAKQDRLQKRFQSSDKFYAEAQKQMRKWRKEISKNPNKIRRYKKDILAFACEMSRRSLGKDPYDVQIMAALTISDGTFCDQGTGEGKTIVAALAAVLNGASGQGVHVATVNDYLVKRDAEEMAPIFEGFGMSVGYIQSDMDKNQRRIAYDSDVTYGTITQFGFDYLKDRIKTDQSPDIQARGRHFLIADEIDQILIDEAGTPLIMSGPSNIKDKEESWRPYLLANEIITDIIARAKREGRMEDYFTIDLKQRTAYITDKGHDLFDDLYRSKSQNTDVSQDDENIFFYLYGRNAMSANILYDKDKHYVCKDGKVVLIDQQTGRTTPGRQLSEGLHQAIEAKHRASDNIELSPENETLDQITIQKYCRSYDTLSGMSGSVAEAASELAETYNIPTQIVPRNKPVAVIEEADRVCLDHDAQVKVLKAEILKDLEAGRPVLVGTEHDERAKRIFAFISEDKDILAKLKEKGYLQPQILCSDTVGQEEEIVSKAGKSGAITISTPMAGRGTDIKLGGADRSQQDQVTQAGGLSTYIFGTFDPRAERQLRGRCGRQGEPGKTLAIRSPDDQLIINMGTQEQVRNGLKRMFAVQKTDSLYIQSDIVNRAIQNAQKKMAEHSYEIRKNMIKYGDVIEDQNLYLLAIIESLRSGDYSVLFQDKSESRRAARDKRFDFQDVLLAYLDNEIVALFDKHAPQKGRALQDFECAALIDKLNKLTGLDVNAHDIISDGQYMGREKALRQTIRLFQNQWMERSERIFANDTAKKEGFEKTLVQSAIIFMQRLRRQSTEDLIFLQKYRLMEKQAAGFTDDFLFFQSEAYKIRSQALDKIKRLTIANTGKIQKMMTATKIVTSPKPTSKPANDDTPQRPELAVAEPGAMA